MSCTRGKTSNNKEKVNETLICCYPDKLRFHGRIVITTLADQNFMEL